MKNKYPRFLSVLCALMIATGASWAVPAYRGWQTRTQPDGTTITIRQVGDEFYHYWETEDGNVAVEQPDGTFVVGNEQAPTGEQVIARRIAARNAKQPRRAKADYGAIQPTKLLVLLVNFSDKSMNSSHNKAFFQNLLNGSLPSVQDYFRTSSGGNYVPVFDVFGPYTLPNNMAYYGGNDSDGNDQHPDQMVVDACALAAADGCNFANYDTNNDGKVDNIYVIYAGYGEAAGAPANTIWPHSWEIYSSNVTGTLKYNNKYLGHYACSAELSGKSGSNSDGVGTFAHEFSHVIGLPDYYDTDYGTNSDNGVTPGEWTLMDQGSYNGSGQYPPLYSIFDKYFMGWATPKFLAKDEVKNVTMTTTWNDAYQITGGSSRVACTSSSTVYYIENRQKSGYDQYLPGHGMIVWTVTYNSTRWNSNDLNNTAGTLRYTIVPADGKTKNYGQASDPFPGSKSKKTWTPFTGCALTDITESSGNINFKYNGGVEKLTWDYVLYGENCTYPDDGEINKGNKLELTITPSSGYTLADAACWDVQMGGTTLTYGTGFTYNSSTNKFTINSVTGDVEILVAGGRTVTWRANGSVHATNVSTDGTITLPTSPANCSSDRQFVGWCTNSSYESDATAPTYVKTGDAYAANFYAVYANVSGGGSSDHAYTFINKSWKTTQGNWDSGQDGVGFMNNGVQVTSKGTGANATSPTSYSNISTVTVSYCTNASSGAGSIKIEVGGESLSQNVTSTGGTTARNLTFDFSNTKPSGKPKITVNCSTNSIYVCGVTITAGSASYSEFSTSCTTCPNTPSMSFTNTSVAKTTDDASYTQAVTITGKGSGQTVAYSSSDESIATVNSSGVVTLKAKAGTVTITASVAKSGDYCAASASYTITVTKAQVIRTVTWSVNGETTTQNFFDGDALTLPTNPADCEESQVFVGWTAQSSIVGGAEPADLFAEAGTKTVTANTTYYAVFATPSGSGAPRRAAAVNDVMWSENWTEVENNKQPTSPSASGSNVYGSATVTYSWTNGTTTTQTYTSGGPNSNENILVSKGNGALTASGIPTGGATELTVTYATSGKGFITVSTSTENVSVSGSTITVSNSGVTSFSLEFKNTSSGDNVRLDDIEVKVKTAGSGGSGGGGGGETPTYSAYTLTCTPVIKHTVMWYACGDIYKLEQYIEGASLVLPDPAPGANEGLVFDGWTTEEHYTGATAPTYISAGTAVNADATYYAVFH